MSVKPKYNGSYVVRDKEGNKIATIRSTRLVAYIRVLERASN